MTGKRVFNEKGQAVLLVVLVMAVVGSVTLSVASRSVSGLRVQEVANESVKAFKAAEAGLERALLGEANVEQTTSGNVSYSSTFLEEGSSGLVTDEAVPQGEVIEIETTGASGVLRLYWNSSAAIKVTEYYGTASMKSYYFDSTSRGNGFSPVSATSDTYLGVNFNRRQDVTLSAGTGKLRVLVLYADSQIGFAGSNLPLQKRIVSSRGELVGSKDKKTVREILYTETEDRLPVVFDHALYTNGSLSQ